MKKRRDFRKYDSTRNCYSCRVKDSHEMQVRCILYIPSVRREKNGFGEYTIIECKNILSHGWCKWGHPDFVGRQVEP
jgi:hypothetical protein